MASEVHRGPSREDLLLDKGKPAARQGRKVTDQAAGLMAGLPKEGCAVAPGTSWVSPQGDHDAWDERTLCRLLRWARPARLPGPSGDSAGHRRGPGRHLDRPHHEYRWKPPHGSGVLSALLRHFELALPGVLLRPGAVPDSQPWS